MAPAPLPIPPAVVPTLQPERDEIPTSCARCESRALQLTHASAGEHFGTLGCLRCGTVVAYLTEPPPPIGSMRERRVPDAVLPREAKPRTIYVQGAVGFERGPDCTAACGETRGHAPWVHHDAGRRAGLAELSTGGDAVIRTGPLAVDPATRAVWVDGRAVPLVGRGADVLLALAAAAPRAVSWRELVLRVWPDRVDEGHGTRGPYHWLSVVAVRVRQRLGPSAGPLVVTVAHYGYRLELAAYTGPDELEPPLGAVPAAVSWARAWAACRECGTTERAHKAKGLCTRCSGRAYGSGWARARRREGTDGN